MIRIKNISLIGLGGIGGAYASKLSDWDSECIRVIVDRDRLERYSRDGFLINGKRYDFNYVEPGEKSEPADLVIVAVKQYHLQQAIKDIRHHVGPHTIILPLLNGISSEKMLGAAYGMDKLLYAMVIAIDAIRQGNRIDYAQTAKIHFGEEKNDVHSPKVKAVKELFDVANIDYVVPENMLRRLWWKFMINVGLNQTSAVLKAPYKVFHEVGEAEALLRSVMGEVVNLSKVTGVHLEEKDIDDFIKVLKTLSPKGKTSMLQDVEAGRKTEVDMLAGTVCALGEKHGIETPMNAMLLKMIRILEQMY